MERLQREITEIIQRANKEAGVEPKTIPKWVWAILLVTAISNAAGAVMNYMDAMGEYQMASSSQAHELNNGGHVGLRAP